MKQCKPYIEINNREESFYSIHMKYKSDKQLEKARLNLSCSKIMHNTKLPFFTPFHN